MDRQLKLDFKPSCWNLYKIKKNEERNSRRLKMRENERENWREREEWEVEGVKKRKIDRKRSILIFLNG